MRFVIVALMSVLLLAACNTFEGMGRDIKGAGEVITGSAKDTKEKMSK